jgi:hypothetical protein
MRDLSYERDGGAMGVMRAATVLKLNLRLVGMMKWHVYGSRVVRGDKKTMTKTAINPEIP